MALCFGITMSAGACDVEWGGASFQLDHRTPPEEVAQAQPEVEVEVPLPTEPLLWVVVAAGPSDAAVRAMPVARMVDGIPAPLDYPTPVPDGYRARFDSAFAATGMEMALGASGSRIGSVVLAGPRRIVDAGCASAVPVRVLLPPGTTLPPVTFAATPDLMAGEVGVPDEAVIDVRIRTFGPILTEQLLRLGGEDQPFLALRAALAAVPWPGDEWPAMAATYLINDNLTTEPAGGEAVSLFFLARFEAPTGYVADWYEMRTYSGTEREAFTWLEAIPGPVGRIDFAIRLDGLSRRLVASVDRGDNRGIDWTEGARCPSLELLGTPGG